MTNVEFVKAEISRYNKRHSSNYKLDVSKEDLDIWGNFISVTLLGKTPAIGYAKCNSNYDTFDAKVGLSIATHRALKRIDGKK